MNHFVQNCNVKGGTRRRRALGSVTECNEEQGELLEIFFTGQDNCPGVPE